jgi:hypothetical protein
MGFSGNWRASYKYNKFRLAKGLDASRTNYRRLLRESEDIIGFCRLQLGNDPNTAPKLLFYTLHAGGAVDG